jgi:malonyl-CoA/methylmalonyl-CoA synthetase
MHTDLITCLKDMAARPDRVWLHGHLPVTYADLWAATGRIANALHDLGLRPGDRLLLQVAKCEAVLTLYLACLRAGVVFLPVNPDYTVAETAYFLSDAEPALAVVQEGRVASVKALGSRAMALQELLDLAEAQSAEFSDPPFAPGDLAAILYTSGTTGRSKGVMLSRDNLASNAATLVELWQFTESLTFFCMRCPSSTRTGCSSRRTASFSLALR